MKTQDKDGKKTKFVSVVLSEEHYRKLRIRAAEMPIDSSRKSVSGFIRGLVSDNLGGAA